MYDSDLDNQMDSQQHRVVESHHLQSCQQYFRLSIHQALDRWLLHPSTKLIVQTIFVQHPLILHLEPPLKAINKVGL